MRLTTIACLFILGIGCNTSKKAINSYNLNGTWIPVQQEIGGKSLPKAAFEKQNLVIADSSYAFTAESVDKGVVRYREGKMDIYGKEGVNVGKHFTAIYKLESDQLTICYNLSGAEYPDSYTTNGKPTYFISVFTREKFK